ncbi:MAG TPA: hypothetical protein VIV60_23180, partial [Polyangiaceae bacterium]
MMSATSNSLPTLTQGKGRPPIILMVSGFVGALGLLSVVAALIWRSSSAGHVPVTAAAAVSAPSVVVPAAAPALPVAEVLPSAAPALTAAPPTVTTAAPVTPTHAATKPPESTRPRAVSRPAPRTNNARAADTTPTPRLRPQDRLERDLGF